MWISGALLLGSASAASLDVEVGREFNLTSPIATNYLLARGNIALAKTPFADLWLLPEVGVFLNAPLRGYAKAQLLIDTPKVSYGAEVATQTVAPNLYLRLFARYTFDFGGNR